MITRLIFLKANLKRACIDKQSAVKYDSDVLLHVVIQAGTLCTPQLRCDILA